MTPSESAGHDVHTGRNLAVSAALVGAAALVGTIGADPTSSWYRKLDKPSWQPPPAAFPIAWTTLYATIGAASTMALNQLDRNGDRASTPRTKRTVAVNLAVNAAWSWLFFRAHNLTVATIGAAALAGDSIAFIPRLGRIRPAAGAVLVPYAAWTVFATALSAELLRRNRGRAKRP